MRRVVCLIALVLTAAWGQVEPLSLSRAVREGVERHPEVRARRLRVDAARAFAEGTGTQPNPVLQLSAVVGDAQEDANQLSQRLEISGQPRLRGEIAELELQQQELSLIALGRRLSLRLARAYYAAWSAGERLKLAEDRFELAQKLHFIALRRYQVGEISRNEFLRAELELARARAELAASRSEARGSQLQLALLLGRPPEEPVLLPDAPEAPESLPGQEVPALAVLLERALSRPEVMAAERFARQGEREAELASKERSPWLDLTAYRSTLGGGQAEQGLMLSLSYPLWDYGEVGAEVARRRGEARARQVDREAIALDLELEVQEAWQRTLEFQGRRDSLRDQARSYRELAELSQRGYDAGLLTLVETLDTQRAYREAQLDRIQAEADAQLSRLELHLVSGGEYPLR